MKDLQIISLYFKRDEAAISETATKYGAFCHGVALNILSINADADECVNDTYLRAWNSIPPQRPDKLGAWLGKVVRNIAFDLWKTSPDYEMEIIENATGKLPAMRGLDFMNGDFDGVVERSKAWEKLEALNTGKPMAFHECGNVPSAQKFEEDGDLWSWFMIWHTDFVVNQNKENLSEVYNSEKVITLDELPKELFE